jgi:S1-C subfamily serine protease
MIRRLALAGFCVALLSIAALADTLTLKNGKVLEGKVIPQGSGYWIKTADGKTQVIPGEQVASFQRSPVAGAPAAPQLSPAKAGSSEAAPSSAGGAISFALAKSRADKVESPVLAVSIWEKFIESNPASADDLANAKAELSAWQKLQKDNAEKINGKWIGGDEKKKLFKQVNELVRQGEQDLHGTQTVEGVKKLEEALKLYPNSFAANFELGYFYLNKGIVGSSGQGNVAYMQKAITSLEAAARAMPSSAATWSNLAIGYNVRKNYIASVEAAYKAAKIEDSKDIVQNLINSIAHAPDGMQHNNEKIKPIMEDAIVLAQKHGLSLKGASWQYIRPHAPSEGQAPTEVAEEDGKAGPAWRGSGFFISPSGYLITNHHVATGDPKTPVKKNITFRVRLDDGTEKNATLIAIDDSADIALMKIKTSSPVPYLKLADDNPRQAAKALVLGYPATGEDDPSLQISEGQVKSVHPGDDHEVWFDLNTTHGNSGGPIVDKSCRVISILTAGRTVYNVTYVMGVGPKQIAAFFTALGDKAPKYEIEPMGSGEFDGEKLTDQAKKATVLITAIRGEKNTDEVMTVATDGAAPTNAAPPAAAPQEK